MKDPITIESGCCVIDRAALNGVVRQDGRLLIFLKGNRPINLPDNLSREEFEQLTAKLQHPPRE